MVVRADAPPVRLLALHGFGGGIGGPAGVDALAALQAGLARRGVRRLYSHERIASSVSIDISFVFIPANLGGPGGPPGPPGLWAWPPWGPPGSSPAPWTQHELARMFVIRHTIF
jgi:hypothetical protein